MIRIVCVGSPRGPKAPRASWEHPEVEAHWRTSSGEPGEPGVSEWLDGDGLAVEVERPGSLVVHRLPLAAALLSGSSDVGDRIAHLRGRGTLVCPEPGCRQQVPTVKLEQLRSILDKLEELGQETVTLTFLHNALHRSGQHSTF